MSLAIRQFPCLSDNYGFLARDEASGLVACIDPPDALAVLEALDMAGWTLDLVVNTHWHRDHSGGNETLRRATGARVFAPAEVTRMCEVDVIVHPGERVPLGATGFEVLDTAGHTAGHVSYYDAASGTAFVGDALFAMGCGRIFEGTARQMWASLERLAALPPATRVYCAHEYTEANGRFALTQDSSPAVAERCARIRELREQGRWTVPTTIAEELATNPFLRAPALMPGLEPALAFAAMRAAKDGFGG
jgi:hydroxyacylglutathione hydrolase